MSEQGAEMKGPVEDSWPPQYDVFWRGVKAELPAGTVLVVEASHGGAWNVSVAAPDRIIRQEMMRSIVDDPPMAAGVGRGLADLLEQPIIG